VKNIFFLLLFLISTKLSAVDYVYDFSWFGIPAAKLVISINSDQATSPENGFLIETKGPLKLLRNYRSNGKIIENESGWTLIISGVDRGETEEKIIEYKKGGNPKIVKFKDDKGVKSLQVDPVIDKDTVDAFSVFLETVKSLREKGNCSNDFRVYDGKRRYRIKIRQSYKTKYDKQEILSCRFESSRVSENHLLNKQLDRNYLGRSGWPFNKKSYFIDIDFSKKNEYLPVKFNMNTPIGVINGSLRKYKTDSN